ncbi:MAG: leucine-rich repeat domain-containing protein [Oscillospiraceae bacterium]|nr:leucine-rich repeat domain-containing protein [Oscillospiraceae bacterium]
MADTPFLERVMGRGSYRGQFSRVEWELTRDGCLTIRGNGSVERPFECKYSVNTGDGWDGHYDTEYERYLDYPWEGDREKIRKIVLEEGITGTGVFSGYGNVEEVRLPETLREIESEAFSGTAIREIHIPESVRDIGKHAFKGTQIPVEGNALYVDGWLLHYIGRDSGSYHVRLGTRGIADGAFEQDGAKTSLLEELTIPGTVQHIGDHALPDLRRVYLGRGCPTVFASYFRRDICPRWKTYWEAPIPASPKICRKNALDPQADSEDAWSLALYPKTERTHDRAEVHPQRERLLELLEQLKQGALAETARLFWYGGEIELYRSDRTMRLDKSDWGISCRVALKFLNELEDDLERYPEIAEGITLLWRTSAYLRGEPGNVALRELLPALYPWIELREEIES